MLEQNWINSIVSYAFSLSNYFVCNNIVYNQWTIYDDILSELSVHETIEASVMTAVAHSKKS